jgi:hypothetical protein
MRRIKFYNSLFREFGEGGNRIGEMNGATLNTGKLRGS